VWWGGGLGRSDGGLRGCGDDGGGGRARKEKGDGDKMGLTLLCNTKFDNKIINK